MTLPGSIQDREYQKFREAADGLPAVAMIIEQDESTTFLQSLGFAGSVGVVDNANGGTGALELLGKTFDKDILFDGATYSSVLGDFYLERINTAGTITWNIHESIATEDATPTANTESVFNLSALGTFTAEQVLGLADLSITKIVSESWEDVSQAEVNIFAPVWQTSKMVGMEPAIAEKAQNFGGNLALINLDDMSRNSSFLVPAAGLVTDGYDLSTGTYSMIQTRVGNGLYFKTKVSSTSHVLAFTENSTFDYVIFRLLDSSGAIISNTTAIAGWSSISSNRYKKENFVATQAIDLSGINNVAEIEFVIYEPTIVDAQTKISGVRLNQGSTANTYIAPLNAPFILGSRSANKLKDGDAEMGGSQWAGVALISSNLSIVAFASNNVIQSYTARLTGPHTFVCRNLTSDAGTVQGILNGVTAGAIAGNATPAYSVGSVGLVAGTAYDFEVRGSADDIQFDAMIIEGEYTQAEIADKGYIAFNPIAPLTCQANDGLSTVVDRIYGSGSEIYFLHNVQENAGYAGYGSPELDTSLVAPPGDLMASDGTANFTDENGALTFDTDHYVYTVTTGASKAGFLDEGTFVVGVKYIVSVIAKDGTGAGASFRVNQLTNAGAVITNGATVVATAAYGRAFVEFLATETNNKIEVEILLGSVADGETVLFDDLLAYAYNIQENLAPNIENITAFGISGSLNPETTQGQNHVVVADGCGLTATWSQGIGGAIDGVRDGLATKLNVSDAHIEYRWNVILPLMASGAEEVFLFSEFNDVSDFPEYIDKATSLKEAVGDTDLTVAVYDTALVISATGDVSDNTECLGIIGSTEYPVSIDRSA